MGRGFDHDDLYLEAEEQLEEELGPVTIDGVFYIGRKPTPGEIEKRAQELYEDMAADAYDRWKDSRWD